MLNISYLLIRSLIVLTSKAISMKKKIVYLGGFELPDKNAAAQRVLSNAKLLREMGYGVIFVGISKDIGSAPNRVEGFESYPIPYPANTKQWAHQVFTFVDGNLILQWKPDYVVLYNFPAVASLRLLKLCHKNGIKVIQDLTEWETNRGWTLGAIIRKIDVSLRMRYCMVRMDGVIAISRYLYDYYKSKVKTILVPPTVDLNSPKWNRNRDIKANRPRTLVYAGSPGSGAKDRLDLIVDCVQNHSNIRLVVVGLEEEQFFASFHRQKESIDNVKFRGRLSHVEAVKAVCDADFQMLIRYHNRKNDAGFPTKLVESMACGTPVIATIFSNINDYIKDGSNAFIVNEENTIEAVVTKLSDLTAEEIITMKENCINLKVFDYRSYKDEFAKLFI